MAISVGRELERHCFEDKVVPLSINGDCNEVSAGLAVPSHHGSDIGSVSQPLDQQRLF